MMIPKIPVAALAALLLAQPTSAGSLKDIKHVVLFMQENRAFDHYFGTMAGIRGFADPNIQQNPDGRNTFQQLVTPDMSTEATQLTPWHINYLGGNWSEASACMGAGSNSWQAMHETLNGGLTNEWAVDNTPWSWAHFNRDDIPTHFDIAEGWTVGDLYQEAILGATDPNRIVWMSGTVNNAGAPSNPDGKGSVILDNNATPDCDEGTFNCYQFTWKTFPEYLQEAGVTWQVYQDPDNFEDNMLAYFDQYQKATNSDGAWLQRKVVEAVVTGAAYNETVLMISYDVGGYGDHVTPFHAPKGTTGEWIVDPYGQFGDVPIGPGFRIPLSIISPWTRGGNVSTEHADHNSQILFVEKWLEATGVPTSVIQSKEVTPWRRQQMSDLTKAFDFDNPDYSVPTIAEAPTPLRDLTEPTPSMPSLGDPSGNYIGAALCEENYPSNQPPMPYGPENANADPSLLVEEGFKPVRGQLTEGRYLTFEMNGFALTAPKVGSVVAWTPASANHSSKAQRWVPHQIGTNNFTQNSNEFKISSAVDGRYISSFPSFSLEKSQTAAGTFEFNDLGNGQGYAVSLGTDGFLNMGSDGDVLAATQQKGLSIFSVTYHS